MRTPSVNIGLRQDGRVREQSVTDLPLPQDCYEFDFDQLVALKASMLGASNSKSIFGDGSASELMTQIIQRIAQLEAPKNKVFFDLK
jgi:hypothetical protein